jgi:hypothetical protein
MKAPRKKTAAVGRQPDVSVPIEPIGAITGLLFWNFVALRPQR